MSSVPQTHDVIAHRGTKPDLYDLRRVVDVTGEEFLEGPYPQGDGVFRAVDLARQRGSNAWIEEFAGTLTRLT